MGFKFKNYDRNLLKKDEAAILPLKSEKKKFNRKCTVQTQVKTNEIKKEQRNKIQCL